MGLPIKTLIISWNYSADSIIAVRAGIRGRGPTGCVNIKGGYLIEFSLISLLPPSYLLPIIIGKLILYLWLCYGYYVYYYYYLLYTNVCERPKVYIKVFIRKEDNHSKSELVELCYKGRLLYSTNTPPLYIFLRKTCL
ncbi:hypothetical protein ACRALDRAFT_1070313 [Sodiomyces alcalophilus JCM 7366]|uniref:uncharacterized protein n=1 Tax=Sodiomyces alcalophilus JCM 7366 TaxID=591952 RepID=UPI0039B57D9B